MPLLNALTSQLEAAVDVKITPLPQKVLRRFSHEGYDAVFDVTVPDVSPFRLVVECLRQAYPSDVQQRIYKLSAAKHDFDPWKSIGWPEDRPYAQVNVGPPRVATMVAAEAFSPGAIDMLEKAGVGYFDLQSGALSFRAPGCYVNIKPVEKTRTRKPLRGTMDLFTDARSCVVHTLLHSPYQWMTVSEVSELAKTSTYTCSTVLQELEKRGWCESTGNNRTLRRRLAQPGALLDAWAKAWKSRQDKRTKWYTYVHGDWFYDALPDEIEKSGITFPWAFTGTEAGNRYAPLLTGNHPVEIVIPPGMTKAMVDAAKLKPVDKGANVTLVERDAASLLFREEIAPGLWIVSPIIAYLDLLDGRGRNKELAEALRQSLELGKDGT